MTAMETPEHAAERQAQRKALRRRMIQARNALKVDGKVGPRTLEKLDAPDAVPAW